MSRTVIPPEQMPILQNRRDLSPPAASPPASASSTAPSARRPALVTLPFTGLNHPTGVAVDTAGNVYVADDGLDRVLKLAADSTTPAELPFGNIGRGAPVVAVDAEGNVYVADSIFGLVQKLPPGST